jgi:hypothetical protein
MRAIVKRQPVPKTLLITGLVLAAVGGAVLARQSRRNGGSKQSA